jgi:hypothetical protein
MRGALSVLLVCAAGLFAASIPGANDPNLTVVVDFKQPSSRASREAMKTELQTILSPVGVKLNVLSREEIMGKSEPGELVYFAMKGSCSMMPAATDSESSGGGRVLAKTYGTDGELLAMGEVECDRVRLSLERVLGTGNPGEHEQQYGTALARVMAHEMYHMLLNAHLHGSEPLTRERLSAHDLLSARLAFSAETALEIREHLRHAEAPASKSGM